MAELSENNVYGMSKQQIRQEYMESMTARVSGLEMVVAGILSDCQQEMAMSNDSSNHVRQQLNVAKFILFEMMKSKEVA